MDLVGRKLGKYEITELIGQGGMATVYKAFQPGVERDVAIKVMYPHLASSPDFVSRFQREARSAGNLQHPHIASVIDFDEEAGVHYLVLTYIQGGTLDDYIREKTKLDAGTALRITAQIADALSYAHERNMIHRDIKPANIMFLAPDRQHALLADFGIARLQDDVAGGLTATGALVGTPNYMSPEAAQGEPCDERSDIYSLGVVLYEMVTGRTPYQADTPYSFLMKQANDPLPLPRETTPDLPESVEQIITKSLEKDPANRYQTAGALFETLCSTLAEIGGDSPESQQSSIANRRLTQRSMAQKSPNNQPMNEKNRSSRSWLPLALAGTAVLLIAILTVFFLVQMEPTDSTGDVATDAATDSGTEDSIVDAQGDAQDESQDDNDGNGQTNSAAASGTDAVGESQDADGVEGEADSSESSNSVEDQEPVDGQNSETEGQDNENSNGVSETTENSEPASDADNSETTGETADSDITDSENGDETTDSVVDSSGANSETDNGGSTNGNVDSTADTQEADAQDDDTQGDVSTNEQADSTQASDSTSDTEESDEADAESTIAGTVNADVPSSAQSTPGSEFQLPTARQIGHLRLHADYVEQQADFELALHQIELPPIGSHYELSLNNRDGETLDLGPLEIVDNSVVHRGVIEPSAFGRYDTALIRIVPDDGEASELDGSVIYSSTLASGVIDALAAFAQIGEEAEQWIVDGVQEQVAIAVEQERLLREALVNEDLDGVRGYAEQIINVIEGEEGDFFGDLDGDGAVENAGNGVGISNYLTQIHSVLDRLDEETSTNATLSLMKLVKFTQEIEERVTEKALQIFAADTLPEVQNMVAELTRLLTFLNRGTDLNGDGMLNLTQGEGGIQEIGLLVARMTQFNFTMTPLPVPDFMAEMGIEINMDAASLADEAAIGSFQLAVRQVQADEGDDTGDGDGYSSEGGYGGYDSGSSRNAVTFVLTYTVQLDSIGAAPLGSHYQAWMGDADGNLFELGVLTPQNGHLVLHDSTRRSILAEFDRVLVTLRPENAPVPGSESELGESLIVRGLYEPEVLAALRAAYYVSDAYPSGLLKGADSQLKLAITHTGFSRNGTEEDDLAEAQRHAEHVVNILVGKEGDFFGDLDRDGLPQNPGDGIGAVSYSVAMAEQLRSAIQSMSLTPERRFYAERALVSHQHSQELIEASLEKSLQIFAADTVEEAIPFVEELGFLLREALNGRDLNGNGVIDPLHNEGGLRALETYTELLTHLPLALVSPLDE